MPYIAPHHRRQLDPLIEALAAGIAKEAEQYDYTAAFAGLLNYACTRLALLVARQGAGPLRYWLIALLTGVFKNLADEFYRRLGQPYEDRQRAQSGDVDLYAEYLKELA
jgi:hypothetical protein